MKSADKPAQSEKITIQSATSNPHAKIKPIAVNFNGGKLTSDAGAILLQQVDLNIRLTERINQIINDPRDPLYTTHQQRDLVAQRIYGIALAYEDVNDHNQLRHDPALLYCVRGDMAELLAGLAPTQSKNNSR